MEYKNEAGGTKTATGYLNGSNVVNFSGLSIWVPKNVGAAVSVKVMASTIEAGAVSGDLITLSVVNDDGTATTFSAVGKSSGTTVYTYAGDGSRGNAMVLRKTKPTVSLVVLPTTVLNDGTQTIARFSISADAAGDVTWKKIGFTYSTSADVAITDGTIKLYKDGDTTALGTPTSLNTTGFVINVTTTNEQTITKGTSQTYVLKGDITGSAANKSVSLKIGIASGSATAGTGTSYTELGTNEKSFAWSDRSGGTTGALSDGVHSASSYDWCDSNYVKTIPTDSQTLSR